MLAYKPTPVSVGGMLYCTPTSQFVVSRYLSAFQPTSQNNLSVDFHGNFAVCCGIRWFPNRIVHLLLLVDFRSKLT